MHEEVRERYAGGHAEAWERYVTAERQELEGRKTGLVGRLLGRPLPSESGEDLRRKRHLASIYQKMGVGSRVEAARKALQREWITITDITDEEVA